MLRTEHRQSRKCKESNPDSIARILHPIYQVLYAKRRMTLFFIPESYVLSTL
jgi:hypothetical protein